MSWHGRVEGWVGGWRWGFGVGGGGVVLMHDPLPDTCRLPLKRMVLVVACCPDGGTLRMRPLPTYPLRSPDLRMV